MPELSETLPLPILKTINILQRWNITVEELSQAILENGSLRGIVFGYVAEIKLRGLIAMNPNVTGLTKDDDHNRKRKGDLRIVYRGEEFRIESKSLQTAKNKWLPDETFSGVTQVDGSDKREVLLPDGSKIVTTNLLAGEFDILAVNCFTFGDEWRFVFAQNHLLPRSRFRNYTPEQREHLLATLIPVTWPPTGIFTADLFALLDQIIAERNAEQGVKSETVSEITPGVMKVE